MKNKKAKRNKLPPHNPDMSVKARDRALASIEYQKQIERVYELLRQGARTEEIRVQMQLERENEITDSEFTTLVGRAYDYGKKEIQKDREYVFQLHMDRYEKMYERAMVMEDRYGRELEEKKDWATIVAKYGAALAALKSKEDLIGIHDKSFVLEFNENKAIVVEKVDPKGPAIPGINLDNLSLEDSIELLGYIQEARILPIEGIQRVVIKRSTIVEINGEMQRVQQSMNIDNQEIEDITYEEMPDNVVSKFIDTKLEQTPPIPEKEIIEDDRTEEQKNAPAKDIEEVKNAFKGKLLSSFKKKMNE